jgi:transcription elongation factor Elf1
METQEQLFECPFCGLEQPPEAARWTSDEQYDAICQECGKKFCGTVCQSADLEQVVQWSSRANYMRGVFQNLNSKK